MTNTQEKLHEPTILGKMVRDYRKSLGLNQTEFALLFGRTTPTAVSFWESGFREIPGSLCIALIDSAKREGAIGELKQINKASDKNYYFTCDEYDSYIQDRIAQLEQSEEGDK